ncbi:unnamed protein product [Caenorhabditis bovis]|uniref:Uncharacterized protein n=1 Tax=Caenorhabditis bovis TaxID=2654633 RepID=A0A8S1EJH3_9PELO|nr:unnamed protein product [Caenorhabditis bovis]
MELDLVQYNGKNAAAATAIELAGSRRLMNLTWGLSAWQGYYTQPATMKTATQQDLDGIMEGRNGYQKSWSIVQASVDKLKIEKLIPVPLQSTFIRQKRHFIRRRVEVDMRRDLLIHNVIKDTQAFQLSYEGTHDPNMGNRVEIDMYSMPKKGRSRRSRHYDFFPQYNPLPQKVEQPLIFNANDVETDSGNDFVPLAFATEVECDENQKPKPLSEEIDAELAKLYLPPMSISQEGTIEKLIKKATGPLLNIL